MGFGPFFFLLLLISVHFDYFYSNLGLIKSLAEYFGQHVYISGIHFSNIEPGENQSQLMFVCPFR